MANIHNHPAFSYDRPLSEREIRLLKFSTVGTVNSDELSFELSIVSRSTDTSYLALSYVWGPQDPAKTIIINNGYFTIGPALERALVHLQGNITLPIWIDAICINQKDNKEKGQQVDRMRDVYQCAKKTIIWLGEAEEDGSSDLAMNHLGRIGKEAFDDGILELNEQDVKTWAKTWEDARKEAIKAKIRALFPKVGKSYQDNEPSPIAAMLKLSEREWFRRVWIIQEFSVATDYEFKCGKVSIPGDYLIAGYEIFVFWIANELAPAMQKESNLSALYQGVPSTRAMTTLGTRKKFRTMSLKQHLSRAFILSSDISIQATDPKDRIYALKNLAADSSNFPIPVDYSEATSYQKVYMDTAKLLILRGHLDVLSMCRYQREPAPEKKDTKPDPEDKKPDQDKGPCQEDNLPSWAPDWTKPIHPPWGGFIGDSLFQASKGDTFTVDLQDLNLNTPDNVVAIQARFFGKISVLGRSWSPKPHESFDWVAALTLLKEVEIMVTEFSAYFPSVRAEAVWRIPIANAELNSLGVPQHATQRSQDQYNRILSFASGNPLDDSHAGVASYMASLRDIHDAKPFLSSNRWVGLCPDDSVIADPKNGVEGDEVFFPVGAHVPYVFRKVEGGCYKLVGEAYVHGLMDGGVWKLKPEPEVQVLRLV